MDWDSPPDAYPGESEEEYITRQRKESQAATGLIFMLVKIFVFALKIAAIFGVFFYSGFILSQKLWREESDKYKMWGISILFTYFIFCIIYFMKGTIIGLRARHHKLWMLPWGICVLLCCAVPAFIVKSLVVGMFRPAERESIWCIGVSWAMFILFSLYTYSIYQFKTPTAPMIIRWSYNLGLKLCS